MIVPDEQALVGAEAEPAQVTPRLPFDFPAEGEIDAADPLVRRIIHEVYGAVDFWTRAPLQPTEMHLDHVFPRLLGGPDNVFNLVSTSNAVTRSSAVHSKGGPCVDDAREPLASCRRAPKPPR